MDKTMENKAVFSNVQGKVAEAQNRLDEAKDRYLEAFIQNQKPEYIENHERVTKAGAETGNEPEETKQ